MTRQAPSLDQATVRMILASLFAGVLYLFGSLAVLVLTARTYCDHRTPILLYALLGFALTGLTLWNASRRSGSGKFVFVLPGTFFLLGTAIPTWMAVHAVTVCVSQGR